MALNPWQALLLGQGYQDPSQQYAMPPQAAFDTDPTGSIAAPSAPSSPGDAGGAATPSPAAGAGAPNAGMLGSIAAPMVAATQQADPLAGDRRQAFYQSLTNLGGLLMAAGQRMSPGDRARILAGVGPAMDINKNVLSAVQTRLMANKLTTAQQDAQRQQIALASLLGDPSIPVSVKQLALQDPAAATKLWAERQNPAQTAFDQELALAKRAGKTDAEFYSDKYEKPDRYTGQVINGVPYSMNSRTGKWEAAGDAPPNPALVAAGVVPGATPTSPGGAPAVPGQPTQPPGQIPGQLSTPTNQSAQFAPPNVSDAFGFQTAATMRTWDPMLRMLGVTRSSEAQARETAISQINTLHNDLAGVLAEGLPGQRSNDARKAIMGRLPPTAWFTTDPSSALNTYKGIYNEVEARAQQAQRNAVLNAQSGQQGKANEYAADYQDARRVQQNLASVMNALASNIQGDPYNPTADAARKVLKPQQGQIPNVLDMARQIVGRGNGN